MPTVAAPLGPPPTTELGAPGLSAYAGIVDGWEHVPELRFPLSAEVYDRMRRDSQIDATLRGADLPIRRNRWRLGTDGVDPRVVQFVADELGLELDRADVGRRRRRRDGVVFADALRHALLARVFGFFPFEVVYNVGPAGPGQEGLGLKPLAAHLRKLGPRMPRSLTRIDVARDGGLEAIRQLVPSSSRTGIVEEVTIGVDRLLMFTHDREGADWTGRSLLRSSYGHWLIKHQLMRLGPLIVERNGMGIPVVNFDEAAGHSATEALTIAKGFRAGEDSGAAMPDGMTLTLVGVTGTLKDELPLLHYHDQAMARAALAMLLNLGHDGGLGHGGLGDTFLEVYLAAQNATITDIEDTFSEYLIRDIVELNYGPDEAYPRLIGDELDEQTPTTLEGLKALADGGLLDADEDVKAEIRRRLRLPASKVDHHDPGHPETDPSTSTSTDPSHVEPITALPADTVLPAGVTADELLKMVNAAAALIRSGFAPDKSLAAVGLDPIEHLGLLPVTVQKPQQPVAGLSAPLGDPTPLDVARAFASATAALSAPAAATTSADASNGSRAHPSPAQLVARAADLAERAARLAGLDT